MLFYLFFGFFFVFGGCSIGLIFLCDYEYLEQWGFGLKQIGWFFFLGDNFNFMVVGDIYLEGIYGLGVIVQYCKCYNYNGNFNFCFDSWCQEEIVIVIDEVMGELFLGFGDQLVQELVFWCVNGILL